MNLRIDQMRDSMARSLETLRKENERQLTEVRRSVDEKLNETLTRSLNDGYRQVAERLEALQQGLGQMRSLAASVSDLNRMMGNVKTRGTWSEVRLGALLEQLLAPGQYAANVHITGGSDVVEYAIVLPGRGEGPVYLPIDSKFPMEDYLRLAEASENGDAESVQAARRALRSSILKCAKDISGKYIRPPQSTDFAVMYLGTEALYAEAARMDGLLEQTQREYRVMLSGPSTFAALLNSLQMGFRTMAVQEQASEIWSLLSVIRKDFDSFALALQQARQKLRGADDSIEAAMKKSNTIVRDLGRMERLDAPETSGKTENTADALPEVNA